MRLKNAEVLRQKARRIEHKHHAKQKGDDARTIHVEIGAQHHIPAAANHQHIDKGRAKVDRGHDEGLRKLHAGCQIANPAGAFFKPRGLDLFLVRYLDRAHSAHGFLDPAHVIAKRMFGLALNLFDAGRDEIHHPDDERQHQNGGGEQHRVLVDQIARHDHHRHRIAQGVGGREADEMPKLLGLRHKALNDLAGFGALEIGKIQIHHMLDQIAAHFKDRAVAYPDGDARHEIAHGAAHSEEKKHCKTDHAQFTRRAVVENHPEATFGDRQELLIDHALHKDHDKHQQEPGRALFQVSAPKPTQVVAVSGRIKRHFDLGGLLGHAVGPVRSGMSGLLIEGSARKVIPLLRKTVEARDQG